MVLRIVFIAILGIIVNVLGSDVTESVFGKNTQGVPAAFGDFNSDELTDLFVIRDKTVDVLFRYTYIISCQRSIAFVAK